MKMVRMLIAGACHDDSQARRAAQARHDGQRPISASGGAAFQGQEGGRDHIPSGSVFIHLHVGPSARSVVPFMPKARTAMLLSAATSPTGL